MCCCPACNGLMQIIFSLTRRLPETRTIMSHGPEDDRQIRPFSGQIPRLQRHSAVLADPQHLAHRLRYVGGVMHRQNQLCTVVRQALQQRHHIRVQIRVQTGLGFIQQQQLRAIDHGARQQRQTQLPIGHLPQRTFGQFGNAEKLHPGPGDAPIAACDRLIETY